MVEVSLLALAPGRLRLARCRHRLAQPGHDGRHVCPETRANLIEDRLTSLVLRTVVQERRDRLVLGAAILQNQAADREEVAYVRRQGCLGACDRCRSIAN
jgi:hypothetical protein